MTPHHIGGYEVLAELGRGGMGVVYRARDPALGREVALKLLLPQARPDPEELERFRREALALARLEHPGIVRILSSGLDQGRPFVVMELVRGRSLAARLAEEGPLPLEEALRLGLSLGRTLAYAHGQGVLHRDLKPANLLERADGQVVLTDFGLARLSGLEALSQTGELLGTPGYMAPEQASGVPASVGPATDVYGLGATLFALLTGRPPFSGGGTMQLLQELLQRPPPPLRALRPDAPAGVETLLARCLAKAPAERYPRVEDLVQALQHELRGHAVRRSPGLRQRLLRGAGSLALLGLGLFAGHQVGRRGQAPTPEAPPPPPAEPAAPSPWALSPPEEDRVRELHLELYWRRELRNMPCGLTFFEGQRLAVGDVGGRVSTFTLEGEREAEWGVKSPPPTPQAGQIWSVARAGQGVVFGVHGLPTLFWWTPGQEPRELRAPVDERELPQFDGVGAHEGQPFAAGADGRIYLVELIEPPALRPLGSARTGPLIGMDVQAELAVGWDGTGRCELWERAAAGWRARPALCEAGEWPLGAALSPHGERLVVADKRGRLSGWDAQTGERLWSRPSPFPLDEARGSVFAFPCRATPGGRLVVAGGNDGALRVYDFTGRLQALRPLFPRGVWLSCLALSPDGRFLAVGANARGQLQPFPELRVYQVEGWEGL